MVDIGIVNAHWFATEAIDAAFLLGMVVEGGIEDVEGAIECADYVTAYESAIWALDYLALARHVLDCAPPRRNEPELVALIAAVDDDTADARTKFPAPTEMEASDAHALLASLRERQAELRASLPIELSEVRTPEGLFPGIRSAADVEKLRRKLGLDTIELPTIEL